MSLKSVLPICLALLLAALGAQAADDFPLRAKYPGLSYASIDELAKEAAANIVVDVRSAFEYDILHIEGVKNISIATINFLPELAKLRGKHDKSKKIFLYCNGVLCTQSYDAGKRALEDGWENVFVFDGGIGAWARKFPERSTFFGNKLGDVNKLISPAKLAEHTLPWDQVKAKESDAKAVFIDVREPYARKKIPELKALKHLPLSHITPMLEARKFQENTIYFMDGSGKQLQWLQYILEKQGYRNYFFVKEGLNQILGD